MAYNKKYPNIKRTGGRYPSNRYGVRFDSISKQQRRLLLEHPVIKDRAQDDQFLQIIFELCRPKNSSINHKFYYDVSTKTFVKIDELKDNYNKINWKCAFSGRNIKSKIDDFSQTNFVHSDYHSDLNTEMVDGRIVKSSIEFRNEAKKVLLKQQKDFIKMARKNSNS